MLKQKYNGKASRNNKEGLSENNIDKSKLQCYNECNMISKYQYVCKRDSKF